MAEIDYSFTLSEEGGIKDTLGNYDHTIGYYPGDSTGSEKSGLTIGHGLDLSYHTAKDLRGWGVLEEDISKVTKYLATGPGEFGPRGSQLGVRNTPLDIYERDDHGNRILNKGKAGYKYSWAPKSVQAATKGKHSSIALSAQTTYESLSGQSWDNLSSAQKTVLFDITYQGGANFIIDKTKNLKQAIINNDWNAVEKELREGQWDLKDVARHKRRADELSKERKNNDTSFFFPDSGLMPRDIPV
jgi:hypothetical protein